MRCESLWFIGVLALACKDPASKSSANVVPMGSGAALPVPSAAALPSAVEQLEQLDQRTPVPLLPMMAHHQKENMRDHLLVVQEVVLAAASDDFAGVERAARRMGYSDQMGHMCSHMGAAAPGFSERALGFHRLADGIVTAAKQRDRASVMRALGGTLRACTDCHASYRQRVVDEATWKHATATAHSKP
ncbi:MAG: hypothetical protein ACOY0T_00385 [Myxococcota bacterium]